MGNNGSRFPPIRKLANVPAPRERLRLVTAGHQPLRVEDLEAVLVAHVLESDRQAEYLANQTTHLLEMVFANDVGNKIDLGTTLDLVGRLSKLRREATRDARLTAGLLASMARRTHPTVQVVANGSQLNVVGHQRVDLGDGR